MRWTISEVSTVSVPADPTARKRNMANDRDELTRDELVEHVRSALGLPDQWGDNLAEDATPDQVRAAAREALQARQAPRVRITRDHTDPATIARRKADAMAFRMAEGNLPDDAREFAPMGFLDMAKGALTRAGSPPVA